MPQQSIEFACNESWASLLVVSVGVPLLSSLSLTLIGSEEFQIFSSSNVSVMSV